MQKVKFTRLVARFLLLIILFLGVSIFFSCNGSKKITEVNSIKEKENSLKTEKIDEKKEIVSKEIEDKITIPVEKSNTNDKKVDSLVDAKVKEILKKLNTSKQSGTNGYSLSYNELKDLLEVVVQVGETKNTIEKTSNTIEEKSKEYSEVNEYIKKVKGIPFYWYIIAFIIIFRKQIFYILGLIFPALKFTRFFAFATSNSRTYELEQKVNEIYNYVKNPK